MEFAAHMTNFKEYLSETKTHMLDTYLLQKAIEKQLEECITEILKMSLDRKYVFLPDTNLAAIRANLAKINIQLDKIKNKNRFLDETVKSFEGILHMMTPTIDFKSPIDD